jgi:hypothetical protein
MSRRCRTLLLALAVAAGAGCVSPTIPIPPPEPQAMVFDDTSMTAPDTWTFEYDAQATYAGAIVYVFNRDLGMGVITTADPDDGSVAPISFGGVVDDEIVITFELEGQLGTTCVRLADGRSGSTRRCN